MHPGWITSLFIMLLTCSAGREPTGVAAIRFASLATRRSAPQLYVGYPLHANRVSCARIEPFAGFPVAGSFMPYAADSYSDS